MFRAPASFEVAIDELEDVRVHRTLSGRAAIDDWSALRFRRVEFIKRITRDPKRAMTKAARERIRRP